MKFLRAVAVLLILPLVAQSELSGQTDPSQEVWVNDEISVFDRLNENTCAAKCPSGIRSKWAGKGGSVRCDTGFSPVCQCTDDSRPLAGCEPGI